MSLCCLYVVIVNICIRQWIYIYIVYTNKIPATMPSGMTRNPPPRDSRTGWLLVSVAIAFDAAIALPPTFALDGIVVVVLCSLLALVLAHPQSNSICILSIQFSSYLIISCGYRAADNHNNKAPHKLGIV